MSININTQYSPVKPELLKPILKIAENSSVNTEPDNSKISSFAATKAENKVEASKSLATDKVEEKSEPSEKLLDEAVQQLNNYVQSVNRNLEFNIDIESGKTVVKVIDATTEELIRQIPNEEALVIAKQISNQGNETTESSGLLLPKLHA